MPQLGDILRAAREQQGLTLDQVEAALRIRRSYLEALEADNFEALTAPVYARGFLSNYARYLGLDPEEMLRLYTGKPSEPQLTPITSFSPPPRRLAPALAVLSTLLILSLIAVIFYGRGLPPQTGALAIAIPTSTPTPLSSPTAIATPSPTPTYQSRPLPTQSSPQSWGPSAIPTPIPPQAPRPVIIPTATPLVRPLATPQPARQPTSTATPSIVATATPLPLATVPSVVGVPLFVAEEKLMAAGLRPIPKDGWNPRLPTGMIYAQDPAAGTAVPWGSGITITVNVQPGIIPESPQ